MSAMVQRKKQEKEVGGIALTHTAEQLQAETRYTFADAHCPPLLDHKAHIGIEPPWENGCTGYAILSRFPHLLL